MCDILKCFVEIKVKVVIDDGYLLICESIVLFKAKYDAFIQIFKKMRKFCGIIGVNVIINFNVKRGR